MWDDFKSFLQIKKVYLKGCNYVSWFMELESLRARGGGTKVKLGGKSRRCLMKRVIGSQKCASVH